ncbi:phage tail sheath subtilisin-like domain-containing protein [Spartinivicinus poritis]|uniref:Phage tail sheath subtilisin-like domain-containing protein n=1 Tax=Spartinivicinus poritis TaxID=2994640 RepID=A0ABT5UGM0_9GAMM|nr:phage tail sheath subtilisin-like domain-containing protein [Spartinivicinus sp. A2-2]MDE1465535.1 phage tail sheath subtilisin-like domain-containing protein [Spartinivicinus sp. A2-2]
MTTEYLHGVEQYFLDDPIKPIKILSASTIGLIATADDADNDVFPLNTPALIASDKLIAKAGKTGTLSAALQDIYRQSGAIVVVVRVPEPENPTEPTEADLANIIGTVDFETGDYTGLKALRIAEAAVGVRPRLIIAPEFSHYVDVAAAMENEAKKLNATAIVDGDESGFTNVIKAAEAFKEVFFVNGGIEVLDTALKKKVKRKASATIAGHIVRVDFKEGYWHSPSNRKLYGITGTSEPVDHAIGSLTSKANRYNEKNVATIVNQQGGWYLYGNRLCNGTMLPHQRVRYIVGDSILYAHQELVDRNITRDYVESVKARVNNLLRRLKVRKVISGGECWVDEELNMADIGIGQVTWDYDLGLYDVAERLTFRQHINKKYNEQLFTS